MSAAAVRTFFSSPHFAVVGASNNVAKFGHTIFAWYIAHALPCIPINPTSPTILVDNDPHPTAASLSALSDPFLTSVSVVTPPPVTMEVLHEARRLGVRAVWLQPGTYDDKVLAFARGGVDEDRTPGYQGCVVAGTDGGGPEGWCVLVDGERGLREIEKV